MFLVCLRKDLLADILSLRYGLVLCLFVVLTLSATAVRTHLYQRQAREYTEGQQERLHIVERITSPFASQIMGHTVAQPPNPLAVFASGLDEEMTRPCTFTGILPTRHADRSFLKVGLRRHTVPSYRYNLALDLVSITNIIASLFALLLVFDGICGEKESGTLKVLLSGPLPRDTVVLSKIAAGLITLLVPLVISWAASGLYVMAIAHVGLGPGQLIRLGLMLVLSCLYVAVCFAVGIFVSTLVQRSATALGICLSLWVFGVLLVPNLLPSLVAQFVPVPSQSKVLAEHDAIARELVDKDMQAMRDSINQEGTYTGGMAWGALARAVRLETHRRLTKVDEYHTAKLAHQTQANQALSRVSPSAAYLSAAALCAGTGPHDYLRFVGNITRYRGAYVEKREELNKSILERTKGAVYDEHLDLSLWPAFTPDPAPLDSVLMGCWFDMALLCAAAVVFLLLAYVRFLTYDVR